MVRSSHHYAGLLTRVKHIRNIHQRNIQTTINYGMTIDITMLMGLTRTGFHNVITYDKNVSYTIFTHIER